MLNEIFAQINEPYPWIAFVAAGAFLGMIVERLRYDSRRRAWRKKNQGHWQSFGTRSGPASVTRSSAPQLAAPRTSDAADQLRIVMGADFSARPLLNESEARVFKELDRIVLSCNPDWKVMAQVSLGEILRCADPQAYGCINSKRVDLLLVDEKCRPRHAVEYQGLGHYQGNAAARDAVKKEALRRAGIPYHEVLAGQTLPSELRRLVQRLVEKSPGTTPQISANHAVQ